MTISELISQLGENSDISRRTIHFYVSEGLLQSPDKRGGGARYEEEHLLRLLLIQEFQKEHYKLSAIRERLDAELVGKTKEQIHARLEEVRSALRGIQPIGDVRDLESFVNSTYPRITAAREARLAATIEDSMRAKNDSLPISFSFADLVRPSPMSDKSEQMTENAAALQSPVQKGLRGVSWVKFSPQEGIEVQVREDVLRKNRRKILLWLAEYASTRAKGDFHED